MPSKPKKGAAQHGKRQRPLTLRDDDAKSVRGGSVDTFVKLGDIKGSSTDDPKKDLRWR